MVQQKRRVRRPIPPAHRPAARPMVTYRSRPRVPWWVIALVVLGCVGLLVLVFSSGGAEGPGPAATGNRPAAGPEGTPTEGSDPPGTAGEVAGAVASRFARPAVGERLQLRVISLGDDPRRCAAASLRVNGEVRTVYHHRCEDRDAALAFFLVRLTGLADDPVRVALDGFELVTKDGRTLEPVALDDVRKRFPQETALGTGAGRKGWVVFELSRLPVSVRYTDGDQVLVVRFPGTWL